jgi:L-threonylcarbamoyladenylate synthase
MPDKLIDTDFKKCLEVLNQGGLILYPTDTVWGIGCDATNPAAVEKIYQLKKRSDEKTMIVLVADEKEMLRYIKTPDPNLFEYLRQTTKPTTVVYENADGLAGNLIAKDGSIAIRICKEIFCRQLIKQFGQPVVSTSANIAGEPVAKIFAEVTEKIKNGVSYIVKYRQKDVSVAEPSSIIKWFKDGTIITLR